MSHIRTSVRGFEWLFRASILLCPLLYSNLLRAAECGSNTPDYTATRSLTVGPETRTSKVYVSGFKIREEETTGDGRKMFTLRLPEQGVTYLVDPARREALALPLPPHPDASKHQTREVVDKGPDGLTVRRIQFLGSGEWRDLSTTTCRPDGAMLEQEFTFIDPQGKLVTGHLTQSSIGLGPLPKALFEIPASIAIKQMKPPSQ